MSAVDPDERPCLVALDPRPVELEDGSPGVALRDPLGILESMAVLSAGAWAVAAHLDGGSTLREVHRRLADRGHAVELEDVAVLVEELRASGFVDGPMYRRLRARALAAYRGAPVRPPICAGGAYPADPDELRRTLDGFFSHPDGPGRTAGARTNGKPVRLLVAPHIDYHRGGPSYAHAYGALRAACCADLFVVFGTAHATPSQLFTLTRQDYGTPLGAVPTDRTVVDALAAAMGEDEVLGDELAHRAEHSCELQMVWLRHLYSQRAIAAVPVLCSSISHLADPGPATGRFIAALERAVAGRRVCYVAAADLAHVGPQFGDPAPPSAAELASLAAEDHRTLSFVASGDAAGFHRDACLDDSRRRLCGIAPIYAALRASGVGARLLHYAQWSDGVDSVSYASAIG